MNPLLFISALILGPLFGLLAGVAIGLWWANRPANDSKSEAQKRLNRLIDTDIHGAWNKETQRYEDGCKSYALPHDPYYGGGSR